MLHVAANMLTGPIQLAQRSQKLSPPAKWSCQSGIDAAIRSPKLKGTLPRHHQPSTSKAGGRKQRVKWAMLPYQLLLCLVMQPRSKEQGLRGSRDINSAHWALTKSLRCLALMTHHVSAWCEDNDWSSFQANWTRAAGALRFLYGLLWLFRLQFPFCTETDLLVSLVLRT